MLAVGLMSGTSMDGIDAALLETDGETAIRALGHVFIPYEPSFKTLLHAAQYAVRKTQGDTVKANHYLQSEGLTDYLLTELNIAMHSLDATHHVLLTYASSALQRTENLSLSAIIAESTYLHGLAVKALLKKTGHQAHEIDLVGYHGQTLYHHPATGTSVIIGEGQDLANNLGISVVYDFRANDIAAGGQGAPFAPLYHHALAMRDKHIPLGIINCGGIANITLIPSTDPGNILGFDTGPGNGLIDRLVSQRTSGKERMDFNGHYGAKGRIHHPVFADLYREAIAKGFFDLPPPKALDIGDLRLLPSLETLSIEDACRTLEAFTADTLVKGIAEWSPTPKPMHYILAGGGWRNPVIQAEFSTRLKQVIGTQALATTADAFGWDSQAMEAQIFAHFAVRSVQGKPLSLPQTTHVPYPMTGGKLVHPS